MRASKLYSVKVGLSWVRGGIILDDVSPRFDQVERLLSSKDLGLPGGPIRQIAVRRVGFTLGQNIPDSGQEHSANGDDSLFVAPVSLDPAIALFTLGIFVR